MTLNDITADVIDAALKIHKRLGPGLLESVYEMILTAELVRRGHTVERQKDICFDFEGLHFENGFRLGVLVDGEVILELKSTEKFSPVYAKQLKTYLVLTGKSVGLVLNFGLATMMEGVKRVVNGYVDDASDEISRRAAAAQSTLDLSHTQHLCDSASLRGDQTCGADSRRAAEAQSTLDLSHAQHLCDSASLRGDQTCGADSRRSAETQSTRDLSHAQHLCDSASLRGDQTCGADSRIAAETQSVGDAQELCDSASLREKNSTIGE